MSRIRSIHAGLFTDEALCAVSEAAVLLWIGLLTEADDHGIFEWKARQLRIRLRPARDGEIDGLLTELQEANAIQKFESDGKAYGAIRNFCKWQRPQKPVYQFDLPENLFDYVKAKGGTQTAAEGYMGADLHTKQNGKCAYCEALISRYQKKANSLRVIERNPGLGTTPENAVAVCRKCCDEKGSLPESEFVALREQKFASEKQPSQPEAATVAEVSQPEQTAKSVVADLSECETAPKMVVAEQKESREGSRVEKEGGEKDAQREIRADAPPSQGSRLTADWVPDKELVIRWITEHGLERDQYQHQLQKFRNYWIAKSGKDATKLDWNPIFENWLLKAKRDGDFK